MIDQSQLDAVATKYEILRPQLNEFQRRIWLAAEAMSLGRGGVVAVAKVAGVSRQVVQRGCREIAGGPIDPQLGARQPGGGRKKTEELDPTLVADLESLVSPESRGDPESPLRWTCKSVRELAGALGKMGHSVSPGKVGRLLSGLGYSLQGTSKGKEGDQHPDRDEQFQYINEQVRSYQGDGAPVVSVDTKKKELVGEFKNGGREYQPQGQPEQVNVHDFPSDAVGKAIPYGVYDVSADRGWVNVGMDHDTAAFAVESLRRWWHGDGRQLYPEADRLLICADAGGSNGYRLRLWKTQLAELARETGLAITVCHFPPATSKWNRIEHRLWSAVTMNWRGRPLTSFETIVNLIGATKTRTGLCVNAELDTGSYPDKIRVSDQELAQVNLERHLFHPTWNYTIRPSSPQEA